MRELFALLLYNGGERREERIVILSIAQINTHAGDFDATSKRIVALSQTANEQEARLMVFPMPVLTGQLPPDYPSREGFKIDIDHCLEYLSSNVACPCLVPVISEMDGEPYHEVMLVGDGACSPLRMSAYKRSAQEPSSQEGASGAFATFELDGIRFVLAQTYEDLDDLAHSSMEFDVVVYMSDYSYALDDVDSVLGAALIENRFAGDARALDAWFVAVGPVGGYGLQMYTGSSFVLSPKGDLVVSAPSFEEHVFFANVEAVGAQAEQPCAVVLEPEIYNRSLHLWQTLVFGLRDYCQKMGHRQIALIVNGDVASCLLAALSSDALGPTNVHAMLGVPADSDPGRAACAAAEALHIALVPCDIDLSQIAHNAGLRADITRACLADFARGSEALVLDCADKTFLALEASAVVCKVAELLPFGDVYRTDLIELAHMRNTISPVIPRESFREFGVPAVEGIDEAESTPEMRLKRIDVTLATYVEWERSLTDVIVRQGEPLVTEAIVRRLYAVQAARETWPASLTASTRPLYSARMPPCFAWNDSVRTDEERSRARDAAKPLELSAEIAKAVMPMPPDIAELLKGANFELQSGQLPPGISRDTIEGAIGEIMGLLQDMSQGEQPSIEGPFGPLTWGSPFSEN